MDLLSYFTGQTKKTLVRLVKGTSSVSLIHLQTCQVDFDSKEEFLVSDKSIHLENVHCNALYQSSMQVCIFEIYITAR